MKHTLTELQLEAIWKEVEMGMTSYLLDYAYICTADLEAWAHTSVTPLGAVLVPFMTWMEASAPDACYWASTIIPGIPVRDGLLVRSDAY